ncbi:hypothetical protein PCASD_22619 [Puccinia coronata f. sp. avenae]|uniref:Uncharacterized protein n=1 Tax=Puccinia coronata f. sp. avenae TaxID=200324 RepID=A0A2N5S9D7_9BASI|nr:hypothetical protein PCASD_22619 [Puccinia coronata f. sp. avenae]
MFNQPWPWPYQHSPITGEYWNVEGYPAPATNPPAPAISVANRAKLPQPTNLHPTYTHAHPTSYHTASPSPGPYSSSQNLVSYPDHSQAPYTRPLAINITSTQQLIAIHISNLTPHHTQAALHFPQDITAIPMLTRL